MRFEFSIGWLLVALVWGALVWGFWRRLCRRNGAPSLGYSDVTSLLVSRRSLRMRLAPLPSVLRVGTLGLMLLGLADPCLLLSDVPGRTGQMPREDELEEQLVELPTRGAAIYLVLDRSGSMSQEALAGARGITRLELLKKLTRQFVQKRPNDMLGLVTFARTAQVVAPLTLDHYTIQEEIDQLHSVRSRAEDGTAIGYALFKTVNLIAATKHFAQAEGRPTYTIASTAIVLVTDGLQRPHPLDIAHELRTMSLDRAAQCARDEEIRVYLINIEPMIAQSPYQGVREEMERAVQCTGGRFYVASNEAQLESIYNEIDLLQRMELPQKRKVHAKLHRQLQAGGHSLEWTSHPLAPYLVGAALVLLLGAIGLDSTWLRRAP